MWATIRDVLALAAEPPVTRFSYRAFEDNATPTEVPVDWLSERSERQTRACYTVIVEGSLRSYISLPIDFGRNECVRWTAGVRSAYN